ncbi:hypothetical protein TSAR_016997 [Trichomalopsis sarcophagae]|uniref:Uncharacterized protein n=1 Tax=Trichomalopsis sarcophagae TaxID=543379 RepID=A0A232EIA9_9HYME|nr:hypothetical protein TSAR_016997 [Trichomalopsis sarcophagae]
MAPRRVNNRDLELDLPLARGWGVKVGFCLSFPWCLDTTSLYLLNVCRPFYLTIAFTF